MNSDITLKTIWYEEITDVYVNIPVPQAGEYANNNLDLFGSGETSKYYIQGGEWCEKNSAGNYIDFDGQQFVLGGTYYVWIYLETVRYLVDDYGLNYYAAFSGCSAESEASFETIAFLAGKVNALGLTTVLTIEGDNHRIAETIVANTKAKDARVLAMDSLQGTTGEDVKNGTTYLGVMEANLEVLKQALTR